MRVTVVRNGRGGGNRWRHSRRLRGPRIETGRFLFESRPISGMMDRIFLEPTVYPTTFAKPTLHVTVLVTGRWVMCVAAADRSIAGPLQGAVG